MKINALENRYYEFLSDYPDKINFNIVNSAVELFSNGGIILLTWSLLRQYKNEICSNRNNLYILHAPNEGNNTVTDFLKAFWDRDVKWPFIISSGDFNDRTDHVNVDLFKTILGRTTEELLLKDWQTHESIFDKAQKPFLFNFLNGVNRPHREKLVTLLAKKGILDKGLWSALYDKKFLPAEYQFDFEEQNVENGRYTKNKWPGGIIYPPIYKDSYFSVVTETNFELPYSYRTEKIYKPLKIGHPFIAAANYGFYRDLHSMGFKTFDHLIDESFDLIDDNDLRLNKIADIVEELCKSNLDDFLLAAKDICKHNREIMLETIDPKDNKDLLVQFIERFNRYARI